MRVASMILRNASYATAAATGLGVAAGFVVPHLGATLVGAAAGIGGVMHDAAEKSGVEVPSINAQTEVDWASLINKDPTKPAPLDIRTFRDDFETLLSASDIKALVVLIDDLDRCSPDRLIENLEAIKLFLAVPRTAFVIAADERIVRHAISRRYDVQQLRDEQSAAQEPYDLVTDYLEKLIQVP